MQFPDLQKVRRKKVLPLKLPSQENAKKFGLIFTPEENFHSYFYFYSSLFPDPNFHKAETYEWLCQSHHLSFLAAFSDIALLINTEVRFRTGYVSSNIRSNKSISMFLFLYPLFNKIDFDWEIWEHTCPNTNQTMFINNCTVFIWVFFVWFFIKVLSV